MISFWARTIRRSCFQITDVDGVRVHAGGTAPNFTGDLEASTRKDNSGSHY